MIKAIAGSSATALMLALTMLALTGPAHFDFDLAYRPLEEVLAGKPLSKNNLTGGIPETA